MFEKAVGLQRIKRSDQPVGIKTTAQKGMVWKPRKRRTSKMKRGLDYVNWW